MGRIMESLKSDNLATVAFFWIMIAIFLAIVSVFFVYSINKYQKNWKKASFQKKWSYVFGDLLILVIAVYYLIQFFAH